MICTPPDQKAIASKACGINIHNPRKSSFILLKITDNDTKEEASVRQTSFALLVNSYKTQLNRRNLNLFCQTCGIFYLPGCALEMQLSEGRGRVKPGHILDHITSLYKPFSQNIHIWFNMYYAVYLVAYLLASFINEQKKT